MVIPISVFAQQVNAQDDIYEELIIKKPDNELYVPDEIIVKFKHGVSEAKIKDVNSKNSVTVSYTSPYTGFKKLKIPKTKSVEEMVEIYSKNPNVEYAEPNYIASIYMVPNDPYYKYQWNFDNDQYSGINMKKAWDISTGSGVVVAVLDTGVAYENYDVYKLAPDLAGTTFVPGYDFVNNDNHPNDDEGHGTHVTGTIAQSTNNNLGVAGVAYDCSIMPVKVLNSAGTGTYSDIADGIIWATKNNADVISMSFGSSAGSTTLKNALAYAYNNGITIVCASGNEGTNKISYPAAYDSYCIAVGATRYDKTRAYYSNYGTSLDIMAPGGDVTVDQNKDGYGDGILQNTFDPDTGKFGYYFFQGTSMATPHVSGVAALLISNGVTGPENVREALESTAKDMGTSGWDSTYGWGIVDAYGALTYEAFTDSFEKGQWNGKWTEDSQNDWFTSTQRSTDGRYSAEVDGLAKDATLTSIPINLEGKTSATITFYWLIESGLDNGEYLAFDVSTDGGKSWVEKARLKGNVDPENVWHIHKETIKLSGINNLKLRFRAKMSDSSEDANVDGVRVVAY